MKYSVLVTPMGSKNTFSLTDSEDVNGTSDNIKDNKNDVNCRGKKCV